MVVDNNKKEKEVKQESKPKILRIQRMLKKSDNVPVSVFYSSNVVPPSGSANR